MNRTGSEIIEDAAILLKFFQAEAEGILAKAKKRIKEVEKKLQSLDKNFPWYSYKRISKKYHEIRYQALRSDIDSLAKEINSYGAALIELRARNYYPAIGIIELKSFFANLDVFDSDPSLLSSPFSGSSLLEELRTLNAGQKIGMT